MIRYLFALLICLPSVAFSQTEDAYKPPYAAALDPANGKEMMKQCSRGTPQAKKFRSLSKADTDSLEQHFNKLLGVKSSNGFRIINLRNYAFQYLGVTIRKKDYIYINAFELDTKKSIELGHPTWKSMPVKVCDGGKSFWGALYDPETKKFSDLQFNGEG